MNDMEYKVVETLESFGLVHCEQVESNLKTVVLSGKEKLEFEIPDGCRFFCTHSGTDFIEIHLGEYCSVAFSED